MGLNTYVIANTYGNLQKNECSKNFDSGKAVGVNVFFSRPIQGFMYFFFA